MVAQVAGLPSGAVRSAYDTVQDVAADVMTAASMLDPSARRAAHDQAASGAQAVSRYVSDRRSSPEKILGDLRRVGLEWNASLNPDATPVAPTFTGEAQRRFGIGMNQGEALFDIGSLAGGGAELKAAADLGRFSKTTAATYVARGAPQDLAEYLAEPYAGIGHHGPLPQRTRLPNGDPLPKAISDSIFNLQRPRGVTNGDFFRHHYRVDPYYRGGRVPAAHGAGGWSGAKLGWTKYGPFGQAWHGTPLPTKVAGYGGLAGLGALADQIWPSDTSR